ncbi:MAG: hypothetical protein WDN67_00865 [Candidatus Moraniibacteriota bacterium]
MPEANAVIDGGAFPINKWVRLNGSSPTRQRVRVTEDGCVVLSWAFGPEEQDRKIEPQRIALKFSS